MPAGSVAFASGTVTQWQVRTYQTIGGTDYERLADATEASATADAQQSLGATASAQLGQSLTRLPRGSQIASGRSQWTGGLFRQPYRDLTW